MQLFAISSVASGFQDLYYSTDSYSRSVVQTRHSISDWIEPVSTLHRKITDENAISSMASGFQDLFQSSLSRAGDVPAHHCGPPCLTFVCMLVQTTTPKSYF